MGVYIASNQARFKMSYKSVQQPFGAADWALGTWLHCGSPLPSSKVGEVEGRENTYLWQAVPVIEEGKKKEQSKLHLPQEREGCGGNQQQGVRQRMCQADLLAAGPIGCGLDPVTLGASCLTHTQFPGQQEIRLNHFQLRKAHNLHLHCLGEHSDLQTVMSSRQHFSFKVFFNVSGYEFCIFC